MKLGDELRRSVSFDGPDGLQKLLLQVKNDNLEQEAELLIHSTQLQLKKSSNHAVTDDFIFGDQ